MQMSKCHSHLHGIELCLLLLEEAFLSQVCEQFSATHEVQNKEYPVLILKNILQVD